MPAHETPYAYRLTCGCIGVAVYGMAEMQDFLWCAIHAEKFPVCGFGVPWVIPIPAQANRRRSWDDKPLAGSVRHLERMATP